MTSTFKTRCDECGWRGSIGPKDPCPTCGAKGAGLSPAAVRRLEQMGMSPLERLNSRPRVIRTMRIEDTFYGTVVRVIPKKTARTAKATAASKAKRQAPVERVAELTAAGYSAAEIAVKTGLGPRWVRKLRARARRQGSGSGAGSRPVI